MKSYKLDMVQYDCPYIRTTQDHDVTFQAQHWDFNHANRTLETRLVVVGPDRAELSNGLDMLTECQNMRGYELLKRKDNTAVIRSRIDETSAMESIRKNGGYVTGPFVIRDGSELWNIGFDTSAEADTALSELDRENEYDLESEEALDIDDFFDVLQNVGSIHSLVTELQNLSDTERETLEVAVEEGYFESPRGTNLEDLSDQFDISKMGASKNLRRSQRKVLRRTVQLMNDLEAQLDMREGTPEDGRREPEPIEL